MKKKFSPKVCCCSTCSTDYSLYPHVAPEQRESNLIKRMNLHAGQGVLVGTYIELVVVSWLI